MATRYWAFLSYAHEDERLARQIQRRIERIRVPPESRGRAAERGLSGRHVFPIFRDRTDFAARSSLAEATREALAASAHLLVLASPAAAASEHVRREISDFLAIHGDPTRVLVIGAGSNDSTAEVPVAAWIAPLLAGEPLYADVRHDGLRMACVKVAAGMLGCSADVLVAREAARARTMLLITLAVSSVVIATVSALAVVAAEARDEARRDAYRSSVTGAAAALSLGDTQTATELLDAAPPPLRRWEWQAFRSMSTAALREIRVGDKRLPDVALSGDGRYVATVDEAGRVIVRERESMSVVAQAEGASPVVGVVLFRDPETVVYSAARGGIGLLPLATGRPVLLDPPFVLPEPATDALLYRVNVVELIPLQHPQLAVAVTRNGCVYMVGAANHTTALLRTPDENDPTALVMRACLLDEDPGRGMSLLLGLTNGRCADLVLRDRVDVPFHMREELTSGGLVSALARGGSAAVATGNVRGDLRVHATPSGNGFDVRAHRGTVYDAVFDALGQLWTAGRDESVACWSSTGEEVCRLPGHRDMVRSIALLDGDEPVLYTTDDGGMLLEWSAGRVVQPGHRLPQALGFPVGDTFGADAATLLRIPHVSVSGDGRLLVTLDQVDGNKLCAIADMGSRSVVRRWSTRRTAPLGFLGSRIVEARLKEGGGMELVARVHDEAPSVLREDIPGMPIAMDDAAGWLAASFDGEKLLLVAPDGSSRLVGLPPADGKARIGTDVALSRDSRFVALRPFHENAQPGSSVLIIETATGSTRCSIEAGALVANVAWMPSSTALMIATSDRRVASYDVDGHELPTGLQRRDDELVTALAFHPTEPRLVLGLAAGNLEVWSLEDGRRILDLAVLDGGHMRVRFTPDGRYLVAATYAGDLRYWDGGALDRR